jgi:hypothetical protein
MGWRDKLDQKIDLRKEWKHLYNPSAKKPELILVPPLQYLMIDGKGNPNISQEYRHAIATLFPLSYALKFALKKEQGIDYSVMPLEGLWWGTPQDMTSFSDQDKEKWSWTAMIMQPDWVTPDLFNQIVASQGKKKDLPALEKVRFESLDEGWAVQMMHIGPYEAEETTSLAIHNYAHTQGYSLRGHHHEIYLKDPSRTAPDKLKTILRQPVSK